jgi:hypothetical protein
LRITEEDPPLVEQRRVGGSHMNLHDLPDEIVQPLLRFGSALLEHVRAHRDHSSAEHENGVLGAWRAAAPAILEAVRS